MVVKQIVLVGFSLARFFDHAAVLDALADDDRMLFGGHRRRGHDFLELRRIGVVVLIEIVQFKDSIESRSAIIVRSDFGGRHVINLPDHPFAWVTFRTDLFCHKVQHQYGDFPK
ncbi:MAG: hypothetical protein ACI8WM_000582 [Burkholderiaceae bacterium]|jgi:hypothetical protein